MKRYIFSLIILGLLTSCINQKSVVSKSKNYEKIIPYVLPSPVTKLLSEKVEGSEKLFYLFLEKEGFNKWNIYLNKFSDKTSGINWIKNTNRKAYINKTFIPLVLSSDEFFSSPDDGQVFLDRINSEEGSINKISILRHNVYHIDFTTRGEILYEGY